MRIYRRFAMELVGVISVTMVLIACSGGHGLDRPLQSDNEETLHESLRTIQTEVDAAQFAVLSEAIALLMINDVEHFRRDDFYASLDGKTGHELIRLAGLTLPTE
ncbi:MAG: hypothetical protein DHS20C11_29440 [Lysobacteraceae bacterium]|nr:MAG: hypothetical protein DHS20C11_29440 [Xanthomonadaceae bacterium]